MIFALYYLITLNNYKYKNTFLGIKMNIKSLIGAACTCLSFACLNASAAVIPDQSQNDNGTLIAYFHEDPVQSFQQSNNNVAGAGIFLTVDSGTDPETSDTVTISLWDALPGQSGASKLAFNSGTGTAGSWFNVIWTPVAVTPNTPLFLVFEVAHPTTIGSLAIAGSTSNPYSSGVAYTGNTAWDNFDYAFRTYADVVVPVPAAGWLFGSGLLGLIGFARRKARN